jgi:hypothetical protein
VRAGQRPEHDNQHEEYGRRGNRVGQQRQRNVPARQAFRHNAGTHHGSQKRSRAEALGNKFSE